jgi:ketosteroid isomerase-like protein
MARENEEIVRDAFEALRTCGLEAFLGRIHPDVVAHTAPEWIEGPEYRGHAGVRSLLRVWSDNFDGWTVEPPELRLAGDTVVALFEHHGTIKGTDAPMRQRMGSVFPRFRDGKIVEARFFQTWEEALEAAGLSE